MAARCSLCLYRRLPRRALQAIGRAAFASSTSSFLRHHSSAATQLRLKRQREEQEDEHDSAAAIAPLLPPPLLAARGLLLDYRLPARSQTGRCHGNGELLRARWLLERDRRGRRLSYKTDIGVSSALYAQITGGGSATRLSIDLETADELRKQLRDLARLRFPLRAPLSHLTVEHGLQLSPYSSQLQLAVATGSSSHTSAPPHCFLLLSLAIQRCSLGLPQSERTTTLTLELQLRVSVFDSLQCAPSLLLMAEATQLEQLTQRIAWRVEEFATGFLSSSAYRLLDASLLAEADTAKAAAPSSRVAAAEAAAAALAERQEQAVQLLQTVTRGREERMSSRRLTVAEPEQAATALNGDSGRQSAGLEEQRAETEQADDMIMVNDDLERKEWEGEAEAATVKAEAQVLAVVAAGFARPQAPYQLPARAAWKFSLAPGSRQLRAVVSLPLPVTPRVWERLLHDLQAPERGQPHQVGSLFSSSPAPLSRLYAQMRDSSGSFRAAHCLLPVQDLSATLRDFLPSLNGSVHFGHRQFTVQAPQRLRMEYFAPSPSKDRLLRLVLPWAVECTEQQPLRPEQQSAVDSFKLTFHFNVFPVVASALQREALVQPARDMEHLSKRARVQLKNAASRLQRMLELGMQQTGLHDGTVEGDEDKQAARHKDGPDAELREEAVKHEQQVVSVRQADAAQEAIAVSGQGEAGSTTVVSAAVPPPVRSPVLPPAAAAAVEPSVPPPPPPASDPAAPASTVQAPREGVFVLHVPADGEGARRGPGGGAGGGSPRMRRLRRWWRKSGFGQSVLLIGLGCVAVTFYLMSSGNFGMDKKPAAAPMAKEKTTGSSSISGSSSGSSRQQQSGQTSPPSPSLPAAQPADSTRPQQS